MSAFTFSPSQTDWQIQPEYLAPFSFPGELTGTTMASSINGEQMSAIPSQPLPTPSPSYHCHSSPPTSLSSNYATPIHLLAEPVTTEDEPLASFSQPEMSSQYTYPPAVTTYGVSGSDTSVPTCPQDPAEAEQGSQTDGEQENAPISRELESAADDAPSQSTVESRLDKRKTNRFR